MRREYGWGPRGERVVGSRPFRAWKTISLIGAIRIGEKPLLMTHHGSVDGDVFIRFTRKRLVPWLRRGDVVILDNLNMHKMKAVRQAIVAAGATPVYLPTYSPELNPIELWWADLKRQLRSLALNAEGELRQAVRRLRAQTAKSKIAAWFRNALRHAHTN